MKILMKHDNGIEKKIKLGFSWTTLFFCWIPSLIRGDLVSAIKLFIMQPITLGIYPAYKSFNINEDYKEFLTVKGYREIQTLDEGVPKMRVFEYIAVILKIIALPLILAGVMAMGGMMMNNMMDGVNQNIPNLPSSIYSQESIIRYN